MRQSGIDIVVEDRAFSELPYWQAMASVGVPPHVSVLFPWRNAPLAPTDLDNLRAVVGTVPSFSIRFCDVSAFPNGTVYASLEPNEDMSSLMRQVWYAFPDTPPYGGEFEVPVPHVTLAKCAPHEALVAVQELAVQLRPFLPLTLDVSRLTVLEQNPDDTWRTAGEVSLRPTQ